MKRLVILLSSLLLPFLVNASDLKETPGLQFQNQVIEHVADVSETDFKGVFEFTNTSKETIEILEVRPTCGCTIAKLDKKIYKPGESGVIKTTFTYGSREGKQTKIIVVSTDAKANNRIKLTMKIDIPKIFKMTPSVLIWKTETESINETKTVLLESLTSDPIIIESIKPNNDNFSYTYEEIEAGKSYKITVTPRSGLVVEGIIRSTFEVQTDFKNRAKGRLKFYALAR